MSSQSKQDLPDGSKTCCEEEEKIHECGGGGLE